MELLGDVGHVESRSVRLEMVLVFGDGVIVDVSQVHGLR